MFPGFYEEIHEEFREVVREFVTREVTPHYRRWDAEHIMDRGVWEAAAENGLLGLAVGEDHGGMGLEDYRFRMVIDEELARADALGLALALHLHDDWVLPALRGFGSAAQQQTWLPRFMDASFIASVAFTEPGAGSDLRGVRTKAVREGEDWVLNGQKTFIGNGISGDGALVLARTDGSDVKQRGGRGSFSLFLVEKEGNPGYQVGNQLDKMGLKASDTAELFFSDVRVPVANLIGEEGQGLQIAKAILPQGRLAVATSAAVVAAAVLDQTMTYVQERRTFDRPVAEYQNTRFRLAELQVSLEVTQRYVAAAVERFDAGELDVVAASKAKMWATERAKEIIDECLQLHGGYGYILEYPVAQAYLAVRLMTIFGGTSEILRETVASDLLR
ncbi:acyl-CoA dehydrogenase family protein [Nesterenkonia xinjiangensis]|uniref:Alkylation response protein AidB-like acyl-CoA dehydrogenase n=1 Tax=Nesterenkonia xinjiangensis TaxID=225327 RepID=A0A7Z0GKV4_9MICC|nr:acyl-CoA dehydrogenase family protein [Nesterenkonia xinjiangensis]NYJ77800.1 alkylation response protein AidB-like acyl-CoA dehydrogenase [Nesterenkonia xinjiangensis]